MLSSRFGPGWLTTSAAVLLVVLFAELFFSVRQNSQTFDESAHMYAGYSYWKSGDFGINPEHPPLAKMIAAIPLLSLHLKAPPPLPIPIRPASFIGGRIFLYSHNADRMLLRARLGMSIFTFALGVLILLAAREMFGNIAAAIALLLFVFEPNVLANGALVTTDMAVSATLFATVYAFYRYTKKPTLLRLLLCALAAGLALCVKHSGLIVFPMLVLLAVGTLLLPGTSGNEAPALSRRRQALRLTAAIVVIAAIAYTMLWSAYGFRYAARPGNAPLVPTTSAYIETLHRPIQAHAIRFAQRHRLLPESYLYGLTDIAVATSEGRPAFVFGKLYPTGQWFYFPSTFLIKSTLGFLLLLVLALTAAHLLTEGAPHRSGDLPESRSLSRTEGARALLFLLLPPALYLTTAVFAHLDIGHRHILPIYAFLIVIEAAGAAALLRRSRAWAAVVVVLLAWHVFSSVRAYPAYLAYSNEIWGGPNHTWTVLTDSNIGWASGLKTMQQYVHEHNIQSCWFAYNGSANLSYFHLPCKPLPTFFSFIFGDPQGPVPAQIQGPVFISAQSMNGLGWGPLEANPYYEFIGLKPDDVLWGDILVYHGSFTIPRIAAVSHLSLARSALAAAHPDVALAEAQQAVALAPELIATHETLSKLYAKNHQPAEASREYQTAMHLYQTTYSAFASGMPPPVDPSAPARPGS